MASRMEDEHNFKIMTSDLSSGTSANGEWLPDEAINTITLTRTLRPELTDETLSERILTEAAPSAALSISHLSKYSADPRIRLMASQYILDKVLGRSGTVGLAQQSLNGSGGQSPVEALLTAINNMAAEQIEGEVVTEQDQD